ncbi:MAG: hypothetical protein JKY99_08050, partial [Rhizobiales bacterium]|nr:hypothetical protein [Hyphomicrobiales bacterium]
ISLLQAEGKKLPKEDSCFGRKPNQKIFALSIGLGLQLEPKAVQYLPETLRILMTSGLLPAALIAIVLNLVLPEELSDESTEEISGGLAGGDK